MFKQKFHPNGDMDTRPLYDFTSSRIVSSNKLHSYFSTSPPTIVAHFLTLTSGFILQCRIHTYGHAKIIN